MKLGLDATIPETWNHDVNNRQPVIQCDCIDKTALLSVCRNGEGMKVDYIEVSKTHKTHII